MLLSLVQAMSYYHLMCPPKLPLWLCCSLGTFVADAEVERVIAMDLGDVVPQADEGKDDAWGTPEH